MNKALAILIILGAVGCPDPREPSAGPVMDRGAAPDGQPVVGGLYASRGEDGSYSVLKVLVVDDFAVHLRSYANQFDAMPVDLDISTLTLGSIQSGQFGIGHFPLAREGFQAERYTFLEKTSVKEEELEGYRYYLEAMKGGQ